MRLLLACLLVTGCAVLCDEYEGEIYTCEPLPAGSPGCEGGPIGVDPKKTFPDGCTARIPACPNDDGKRTFSCRKLDDGRFVWVEAL